MKDKICHTSLRLILTACEYYWLLHLSTEVLSAGNRNIKDNTYIIFIYCFVNVSDL